ncbi:MULTISPECIES: cytochrome-c oxidase, cbb3-type subunit III [unclassified Herbaspirillum]|uniref:cytochrome-c oxidase, cbb3-type subunit III n=1 Tax=unclassified Herbaspirillum TaxID=2624150 RepID=UPI000E2E7DB0|nr:MULTISPECIES: cytochrome-c oxidase, cbb3-type subunit III [unclassified Herbaspirillum]RFB73045.1 cytochrome-c oxidase, cbb3-type subunit III [Herbaspirillum sp. 3R-3a1]TFI11145.1 cytochrome-c oxidase, cbb3-type subunit III [Herbaspirillum sp. 3R11]TFI17053.1 cytochrome-c oxidase, cbb3-type subunit III [Herbaspirillum sp. 3R-11]TFI31131.1 cytochrome-c oxidase, cbb3-type subunit III [Herbaspirillum sp. 3C11]
MSDFTSGFWNIYITSLTIISIIGCGVLLWSQSKVKVEKKPDQDPATVGTTGHVWDGDLTELNTPMPRWWMWLFYLTIVFALVYLYLYPGLGTYAGKLGWKSSEAYQGELKKADADYGPLFNKYLQQDIKTVAADPQAHVMGERLFLTYCAQCHGSDARGSKGFPNLTDKDWLYGGDPDVIKTTILHGRNGQMPSMAAALGSDKDVENVAHYVLSLSDSTHDPIKAVFGKSKFAVCAGCHGAGGTGNQALGAPNLSDKIWLYGGGVETVMETIRKGRNNTMPAFESFLGEAKVHVLASYVWSLSNAPSNADQK